MSFWVRFGVPDFRVFGDIAEKQLFRFCPQLETFNANDFCVFVRLGVRDFCVFADIQCDPFLRFGSQPLGRRNITPDQFTLLLGRRYNRAKKAQGGRADRDFGTVKVTTPNTAEKLAKEHGVSEKTVRNAGQYADAIAKVEKAIPGYSQAMTAPRQAVGSVNQHTVARGQNDPQQKTADKLAAEHGVSPATVKRAGQYADAIATVERAMPGYSQAMTAPSRALRLTRL